MKRHCLRSTHFSLLLPLLATASADLQAQDRFPSKPIQLLVSQAPGGSADFISRALAERMSESIQQPVVVLNQPGANGGLAAGQVARAAPDGYTLLMAVNTNLVVNPSLYTNLPYDPFRDFAPVSVVARGPMALIVSASGPGSIAELIARAKASPGKLNYASVGFGSTHHLGAELFKVLTKTDVAHIPYKGTTAAVTDLLAGIVHFEFAGVGTASSLAESGKIRILAVGSPNRSAKIPDVPTMEEAGVPGFELSTWFALLAPAKTPPEIISRISQEIRKATADPRLHERLTRQGMDVTTSSPADLLALMQSDTERWKRVIEVTGTKAPEKAD
jgi:tripartite-type tricarboxylate transporter receptor subunit TctC